MLERTMSDIFRIDKEEVSEETAEANYEMAISYSNAQNGITLKS